MKKVLLTILMFFSLISKVYSLDLNLTPKAKSAILVEASTGEIIYEKNKDERLAPASMTKIMSLILIMEEIEKGTLKLNEEIIVSENASSMGGSQIFLEKGEKMTVDDLLKAICVGSANELAVSIKQSHLLKEEIII